MQATASSPKPSVPLISSIKDINNKSSIYFIITLTSIFSLLFILSLSSISQPPTQPNTRYQSRPDPHLFPPRPPFTNRIPSDPTPPSIAYLISGSKSDSARILRLLYASYHPRNHYLLHLDLYATQAERDRLALTVQSLPLFRAAQNVNVIGKADFAYPKGSSPISATLHGASILLRLTKKWDWFINLRACDYPLVTQDDLLHIISYLPKDLNFVNHSSYVGWKESRQMKPIIVDPGLYLSETTEMFYATQKRELPNAFRLFTGSTFSILSHDFIDFCILGTDNFPRILLMYLSNTPSSLSNYFPTILCNSRQFNRTVVNHNLLYVTFNKTSKEKSHSLTSKDFDAMIQSGAAFATEFQFDDPILDRIDQEILRRSPGKVVPGGWCLDGSKNGTCSNWQSWGDADILSPGPGARRLETRIVELLNSTFRSRQCI
ncbi:Branch domain-containing protein [Cephalotus follicularis]|uniref:Branch domain-containing protein n=1 Tax=Cephalotus follicularis TaxID=3775 RepID=A0A1Q3C8Q2_CEPFO|nr:Branch domain-containing protein [Cephalotus follicularis]